MASSGSGAAGWMVAYRGSSARAVAILALAAALSGALPATAQVPVTGVVSAGPAGKPLAGVEVRLLPRAPSYRDGVAELSSHLEPEPSARTRTDADGRFRLEAPAPGMWRVVAEHPGYVPIERPLTPLAEPVALPPVHLLPARRLVVRVVAADGRPVAGARVRLGYRAPAPAWEESRAGGWQPIRRQATSDGEGRAPFAVATGESPWFQALAPEGSSGWRESDLILLETIGATAGETAPEVTLRLPPGTLDRRPTTLRLLRPDGTPMAGALVRLGARRWPVAVTDDRGLVTLALGSRSAGPRPGAGTDSDSGSTPLVVESPTGERWSVGPERLGPGTGSGGSGSGATASITLTPEPPVAGRLSDTFGAPLAGGWVWPRGEPGAAAVTGADGSFRLAHQDGVHRLRATAIGHLERAVRLDDGPHRPTGGPRTQAAGGRIVIALPVRRSATGQVLATGRRPVAGAEVTLSPVEPPGEARARTAQTGADGSFELRDVAPGLYDLAIRGAGISPARVPGLEIPQRLGAIPLGTVVLGPAALVRGSVETADGVPVADATVRATPEDPPVGEEATLSETVTGEDGRFELGDLAAGARVSLRIEHPDHASASVPGVLVPSAEPIRVVLDAGIRLEGRVLDEAGRPVADARVLLEPAADPPTPPRTAVTDAAGLFVLDRLSPGPASVSARARGYLPAARSDLVLEASAPPEPIELRLAPAASIAGRVFAPDGEPIADVRIAVLAEGAGDPAASAAPERSTTSGADGRFRLDTVAPGVRLVEARHDAFPPLVERLEVGPGDNALDLTFEAGASVTGRVSGPGGEPVPGASLHLERADAPPFATESAADGSFRFSGVAEGRYTLRGSKEGWAEAVLPEPLDVTAPGVAGVELLLEPSAAIVGRLGGLGLGDLARVEVTAFDGARRVVRGAATAPDGYRVRGVGPGRWWVAAELPDGRRARGEVSLAPGETRAVLDLDFEDGLSAAGRVLLGGGPLAGARISLVPADGLPLPAVATDRRGRFRIDGLTPGSYTLEVTDPARGLAHGEEVRVPGAEDLLISLDGGLVAGWAMDTDGAPVAGAALSLRRLDGAATATGRSGDDGSFRFDDVLPGPYRLSARHEGFAEAQVTVELAPGEERTDLTLRLARTEGLALDVSLASGGPPRQVNALLVDAAGGEIAAGTYTVDRSGRARVEDAPAGAWRLLISAPGTATATVQVSVPGPPVPLTLPAGGSLDVRVPALADDGVAAVVRLAWRDGRPWLPLGPGGRLTPERPMAFGRALLDGVPAGSWTVVVDAPDGRRWRAEGVVVQPPARTVLEPEPLEGSP